MKIKGKRASDSLNVCIIGQGVHPPWNEGCAVVTQALATSLSQKVKNIFLISPIDYYRGFDKHTLKSETGISEYIEAGSIFESLRINGKYIYIDQLSDLAKIYRVVNKLNSRFGIDIIHLCNVTHLTCSLLCKIFPKKPIVAHIFGSAGLGDILSAKFVNAFACTSQKTCNCLINKGIQAQKVHYIPPIIDYTIYKPTENLIIQTGLKPTNFIITYIGNVNQKRLSDELIIEIGEIAKKRPEIELRVYCPDTSLNRVNAVHLKQLLSNLKVRNYVIVINLTESEKIKIMNKANLMLFPYFQDAVIIDPPIAVLEAMACGKIVLASRTFSIPEFIINNKNGFLFEAKDMGYFRETVTYLIENYANLNHIGLNARLTIQKSFSSEIATNLVLSMYRSIIDKK
jgi:glycosyltransferase involved in cell wall biosynthesis